MWVKDLDALVDVLDEIAEATRKQEIEDEKQRKNAGKRKVEEGELLLYCTTAAVGTIFRS